MKREQYLRSNKVVFITLMIIMVYLTFTFVAAFLTGTRTIPVIIQVVVSIVSIIVDIIAYVRKRGTRVGGIIMQASATIAFGAICVLNQTEHTWLYTLPILMLSMAYLDTKNVVIQNIVLFIINLARLILFFRVGDKAYEQLIFMVIFVLILTGIASISITRLLTQYNTENVATVQEAMDAQEASGKRIIVAADDVVTRFDQAMEMVSHLEESVNTAHFAMGNIADSTENTAEAVQQQAEMCARIQENTDHAEQQSVNMMEVSSQVTATVAEGAEGINELLAQSKNVEEASSAAVQVISRLTERVEEVQGFVGSILNISSQTNLLSLNASIEAARAGEAGKGFAVVADEIRQLSEQTKEASNSIQNIIQELNEDTRLANESIENSVASVIKQNEMIAATGERFEKIDEKVTELSEDIISTEKLIKEILEAASRIADSLTNLSATSEEVAASSGESLRSVENAVDDMNETKGILEEIFHVAQDLKQST